MKFETDCSTMHESLTISKIQLIVIIINTFKMNSMKRTTFYERLPNTLDLLDDVVRYALYVTLVEFVRDYKTDELSPTEIIQEAGFYVLTYTSHPHPKEAIAMIKEALFERYATFDTDGIVLCRSDQQISQTIFLVFSAMLFKLKHREYEREVDEHIMELHLMVCNHHSAELFASTIQRCMKDRGMNLKQANVKALKPAPQKYQPPVQVTFVERVKEIICEAAAHNDHTVKTNARGQKGSYQFYIDKDCFCQAIDDFVVRERECLMHFLDGNPYNVQIKKVAFFIGQTIKKQLVSSPKMQATDLVFAFKKFYDKDNSIKTGLSCKAEAHDHVLMMNKFENYLKLHLS